MLNLAAVVDLLRGAEDILLVAAGTDGHVTLEDVYLAGRISAALEGERSDAALVAEAVAAAYQRPIDALEASRGAIGLRREGLQADIAFCARESIIDTVPRLTATNGAIPVLTAGTEDASDDATALGAIQDT